MQFTSLPVKLTIPWGNAAGGSYITTPQPLPSQIAINAGRSSFTDGFPPVTFSPVGAGGTPPFGQDMNGILNMLSAWNMWNSAGGLTTYDATWSAAVTGYPKGAIVASSTFKNCWFNLNDNNTNNPDTTISPANGWIGFAFVGSLLYLQANTTWYVNAATGNDANNGLASGTAWATMQHAASQIALYNLNGFVLTISVAATGTYAATAMVPQNGSGTVAWVATGGVPAIVGSNASALSWNRATGTWSISGFSVSTAGTSSTDPLAGVYVNGSGTTVSLSNMTYGVCPGGHKFIGQDAIVGETGTITVTGGCAGSTLGVGAHCQVTSGGIYQTSSTPALTISNAVTINYWMYVNILAFVSAVYGTITGKTNVTGTIYLVAFNAVLQGGGGATYFPGTVAGTSPNGGQYS